MNAKQRRMMRTILHLAEHLHKKLLKEGKQDEAAELMRNMTALEDALNEGN
mgnify:CR=1 FL=1